MDKEAEIENIIETFEQFIELPREEQLQSLRAFDRLAYWGYATGDLRYVGFVLELKQAFTRVVKEEGEAGDL